MVKHNVLSVPDVDSYLVDFFAVTDGIFLLIVIPPCQHRPPYGEKVNALGHTQKRETHAQAQHSTNIGWGKKKSVDSWNQQRCVPFTYQVFIRVESVPFELQNLVGSIENLQHR